MCVRERERERGISVLTPSQPIRLSQGDERENWAVWDRANTKEG